MLKDTIGDSTPGTKSNYQEESSLQDHHQTTLVLLPFYNTKWPSTGKKSFFCRSEAALHLTIGQMILIRSFNFYFSVTRRRSLILAVFILFFSGCCFYLIYQKIGSFYSTLKMKGKKEGTQSDWTFPLQSLFYYSHSSLVAKEADNWTLIGWISLTLKNNSRTKKIWLSWPRYTGTKRLELTRLKPPSMARWS